VSVAVDAPAAPLLPPSFVTDPMAGRLRLATFPISGGVSGGRGGDDGGGGVRRMRRRRPPTLPRQLLPPPVHADRILFCSIVVSTAPRRGGDKVWRLQQRRCLRSTSAHCSLGGRIGSTMRAAALQRRMTTTLTRKQGVTRVISWRSSSANFGKGVLGGGERQQ
jgi:hypothetical protein